MFNTLGSFSAVYFALAAVLFILILFEKHFINLEEKIKAKKSSSSKAVKSASHKNTVQKSTVNTARKGCSRVTAVRRAPNNAA